MTQLIIIIINWGLSYDEDLADMCFGCVKTTYVILFSSLYILFTSQIYKSKAKKITFSLLFTL